MNIGFIGFGEAAFEIAKGLKQEGLKNFYIFDVLYNQDPSNELIRTRIETINAKVCSTEKELLEQIEMLFVAVPANITLGVAQSVEKHLHSKLIYADVSAATPSTKRNVAKLVEAKGVKFIDVAMMGPLTVYQHKVPILASGSGTDIFKEIFAPYGMNITKVSEEAGNASSVKLIRSIYMKGLAGLFIEMLEIAHKNNVQDYVVDSIAETMDSKPFAFTLNRMVTGTAVHSLRRSKELEGSIELLQNANVDATMTLATYQKLNLVTNSRIKESFGGKTPHSWIEVIQALDSCRKVIRN